MNPEKWENITLNKQLHFGKNYKSKKDGSRFNKLPFLHKFGSSSATIMVNQLIWDDDSLMKSMGFLFRILSIVLVFQYCHGNNPPLLPHIHATFALTLHEVNRLLFPHFICFLSHSSSLYIP